MKKIYVALLCLIVAVSSLLPMTAFAAAGNTADAVEEIDLSKVCSLTVKFAADTTVFENQEVCLYKVATVDQHLQYSPVAEIASASVDFSLLNHADEYHALTRTVNGLVLADSVKALATKTTDDAGEVVFADLEAGMYLVSSVRVTKADKFYTFESFMVSVPGIDDDGKFVYDVVAAPKAVEQPVPTNGLVTYSVIVSWKDNENEDNRPDFVEVVIYKGKDKVETVKLSAENNWKYDWTVVDDGTEWNVAQITDLEGYTSQVSRFGDVFTITNTAIPKTGDSSMIGAYAAVMSVSGLLLVGLALGLRKKDVA